MRLTALTAAALLAASTVYAQNESARRAATEVAARVPLDRAVKGAPYSADTLIEATQQLADGNRIVRKTGGRVYRDGEGRVRREEDRPNGTTAISISDPVAGFSYTLDTQNKIAWRTPMGTAGAIMNKIEDAQSATRRVFEERVNASGDREVGFRSAPASEEERRRVEAVAASRAAAGGGGAAGGGAGGRGAAVVGPAGGGSVRVALPAMNPADAGPLERKVLDGLPVEGRKTTTVIPAGQIGNEQAITIASEQWRSPDLNILVMTRHSDPRSGESTYRLQNIIRAEPDRSLFMVPAEYAVKESGIRRMELDAPRRR